MTTGEAAGEVSIVLDAEETPLNLSPRTRFGRVSHVAALPRGMTSGKASAVVVGKLKDGSIVALQTSLRLLLQAAEAFLGRYGVEADGKSPARHNDETRERINAAIMLKLIKDREGSEVTIDVAELNRVMQDVAQHVEMQFSADGATITIRAARSE